METDSDTGEVRQKLLKKKLPTDATKSGKPFLVRDFVICMQYFEYLYQPLMLRNYS